MRSYPRGHALFATNAKPRWATRGAARLSSYAARFNGGKRAQYFSCSIKSRAATRCVSRSRLERGRCVLYQPKIVGDIRSGHAHALVGLQIHSFIFHAAPHTLQKDVVTLGAPPVHGQLTTLGQHGIGEFHCRERAALIRIDNLGRAMPGKGLLDHFLGVNGF